MNPLNWRHLPPKETELDYRRKEDALWALEILEEAVAELRKAIRAEVLE